MYVYIYYIHIYYIYYIHIASVEVIYRNNATMLHLQSYLQSPILIYTYLKHVYLLL